MVKLRNCFLAALLPFVCVSVPVYGIESDYEMLKGMSDEKSIPLVNICTDIETVNKDELARLKYLMWKPVLRQGRKLLNIIVG